MSTATDRAIDAACEQLLPEHGDDTPCSTDSEPASIQSPWLTYEPLPPIRVRELPLLTGFACFLVVGVVYLAITQEPIFVGEEGDPDWDV